MFDRYRTTPHHQQRWLDDVCAIPDAFVSLEQAQRRDHLDLAGKAVAALGREREAVRLRLLLDPDPDEWLVERFTAIGQEIARRAA